MDTEFVNAYIERMKATLDDFLAKNILIETQLIIATHRVDALTKELTEAQSKIEMLSKKKEKIIKTEETSF